MTCGTRFYQSHSIALSRISIGEVEKIALGILMVLAFPPGKVLLQDALNSIDVFGLNRCKYCDG